MIAVYQDKPEIVLLLLENGANPNIKDFNGDTALIYALEKYIEKYNTYYLREQYQRVCLKGDLMKHFQACENFNYISPLTAPF